MTGLVWESSPGRTRPGHQRDWGGIAVFATAADREDAIRDLQAEGYRYFVRFQDAQGAGLSYGERQPNTFGYGRIRPCARERLPSMRRYATWSRAMARGRS